jgi:hypothetical protein
MRSRSVCLLFTFSIVFTSCNQQQSSQQSTADGPGITLSWKIEGCAEEKKTSSVRKNNPADNFPLTVGPAIVVKGDSITYSRTLTHLCCRKARVSILQKDSILTIQEYWYHKGCKCQCNSTVSAVLNKIAAGNYQLYIIEAGTDPVDDKPMLLQDTIWVQRINIK